MKHEKEIHELKTATTIILDTFQDFLIKLGIKPCHSQTYHNYEHTS
jgi:hypothetical protein